MAALEGVVDDHLAGAAASSEDVEMHGWSWSRGARVDEYKGLA